MTLTTALSAHTFNPSTVSSHELAAVKNASSRDEIGCVVTHILDKVSDWFCGTQRAKVKKQLFDMYSPTSTDQVKITAFLALQAMAGEGYKDGFQSSREDGVIRVHALSYKDVATMQDRDDRNSMLEAVRGSPLMQKSSEISIDVAVSAQGHMNVVALDYLANNGKITA